MKLGVSEALGNAFERQVDQVKVVGEVTGDGGQDVARSTLGCLQGLETIGPHCVAEEREDAEGD